MGWPVSPAQLGTRKGRIGRQSLDSLVYPGVEPTPRPPGSVFPQGWGTGELCSSHGTTEGLGEGRGRVRVSFGFYVHRVIDVAAHITDVHA